MNFLKSGWTSIVGSAESNPQIDHVDTIEKLIERVETSTLLEDRRDACRTLKSLAKTYRLEVGAQGMNSLITVLLTDTHDNEIISYTLDALCYIISGPQEDPNDYEVIQSGEDTEDLSIQFTEIFAKKKENIAILIDLLEEYDFKVKWPALKLLTSLLRNKLRYIQELILEKTSGISKIIDLLQDSREIIRNGGISLLVRLTRGHAIIQKIVTFENAFDNLFDIMVSEGLTDGGVVVEDCLIVCQNLLKNNSSNQIFFKEGNYIQKLVPFLELSNDVVWCPQKEMNFLFLLYVIRTLVSPTNSLNITSTIKKIIFQIGIFERLCDILLTKGIPLIILSETINTVGEVIRGDNYNQKYFFNLTTPVNPPKPIMVVFLSSLTNEKQSFNLRCAILYCFQCFLHKNEFGQAQIIQTLLPSTIETSGDISVGQLLCSGLFSQDSISQWFVSVAFSHLLIDNKAQKEQLIRVQLATDVNSTPIPLLNKCCTILQESIRFHSKLGILILLSTWLSNCTFAVMRFLEITTNVPYLISQITLVEGDEAEMLIQGMCAFLLGICIKYNDNSVLSFTKEDMCQLINKRIGVDAFIDKINLVSNHETYSATLQKPLIKFKKIDDVVFDYEFCKLYKALENDIIKIVRTKPEDFNENPELSLTDEQQQLLNQYKNLIRDQNCELDQLKKDLSQLTEKYKLVNQELNEVKINRDELKDLLALKNHNNMNYIQFQPSQNLNEFPPNLDNLQSDFSQLNLNVVNADNKNTNYQVNNTIETYYNMENTLQKPNNFQSSSQNFIQNIPSSFINNYYQGTMLSQNLTPSQFGDQLMYSESTQLNQKIPQPSPSHEIKNQPQSLYSKEHELYFSQSNSNQNLKKNLNENNFYETYNNIYDLNQYSINTTNLPETSSNIAQVNVGSEFYQINQTEKSKQFEANPSE